ncbi:hypothetical protein P9112_004231 [Eukaryota sp. TZLM1-RC]
MKLDEFDLGPVIGEGAYAVIRLGRHRVNGTLFAIKIISKAHVYKLNKVSYVQQERTVLSSVSHPNIIRLHSCFQDERFLYFVLELATRGDLQMLIKKNGPLPIPIVCHYALEIISALHYLRTHNIIHRDLKPSNILIAEDYSLKLTDFGTAKTNKDDTVPTQSFAGTASYVAPEMLESGEFSLATDLWSLGIVIYELIEGSPPFAGSTDYLTFQLIMDGAISFSSRFSAEAQDLITKLLNRDPLLRFGLKDASLIANHPFFSCPDPTVDFSQLNFPHFSSWNDDDLVSDFEESRQSRKSSVEKTDNFDTNWQQFILPEENVVFTGMIRKRTRITPWRIRRLVLTDQPRFFYIDMNRLEIRGEIPWSDAVEELSIDVPSSSKAQFFRVEIPNRKYIMESIDGNSGYTWARHLEIVQQRSR